MILPIVLTGRLGLPSGGVPNFALDSSGSVVGAEFWPAGSDASGVDPATGEPATAESGAAVPLPTPVNPNIINLQPLRDTGGVTQWTRQGGYSNETPFDRWRRAGRPTRCSLGAICPDGTQPYATGYCDDGSIPSPTSTWSGSVASAIAAGVVDAGAALLPAGSIIQSGPNGITVATPASVSNPGGTIPYVSPGSITATATASPAAWILGIAIVGGLFYLVSKR